MNSIRVIIYDLDDTLIDTTRDLIPIKDSPLFAQRIREPIALFEGAVQNLTWLAPRANLFLLTYGELDVQKQKIKSAGIEGFFQKIFFSTRPGEKHIYFQKILEETSLPPPAHLSFGNRVATDLAPAKALGMKTCLFDYGEHQKENKKGNFFTPNWTIDRHRDFLRTCGLLEGSPKKV